MNRRMMRGWRISMRRTKRRKRMRIRLRLVEKNLGRLARERWYIHQLTMKIPW